MITFHPVTLEYEQTEAQAKELLGALEGADVTLVFTYPGADASSRLVIEMLKAYAASHPAAHLRVSLGTQGYFSLMKHALAMVGNSSSGIIEAASFKLPVVNIGNRQQGRARACNVIDVGYSRQEIQGGIERALSPQFREDLRDLVNPYGDGHASEKIVKRLKEVELDPRLIQKQFHED